MERLAVLKIEGDNVLICGFFDSKEMAIQYLTEVKKMIDFEVQHNLAGEYIAVPALYFNLEVEPVKKKEKTAEKEPK
jgi:hypothetical protein